MKGNNRQTEAQRKSTLDVFVAAAVCGTSSLARLYLLVGLAPCFRVCRLRPAFVNYAHAHRGCFNLKQARRPPPQRDSYNDGH